MIERTKCLGPIAVGGLGGSGTRVVAEILLRSGFYMGSDLNSANDNLWFTILFKRPEWYMKTSIEKNNEIFKGLRIFDKLMSSDLSLNSDEIRFIIKPALKMSIFGHEHTRSGRGIWPMYRIINMLRSKQTDVSNYIGWGWKEPNTHIYIDYLNEYFDEMKYIHVIRHGLDMAFSKNQAQLFNWGKLFRLKIKKSISELPKVSLQYWIEANNRAVLLGKKLLDKRFYLLNFDELCLNPRREITSLINFLGIDINSNRIDKFVTLPRVPKTAGRYKKHDLSVFSKEELEVVREFGFIIE